MVAFVPGKQAQFVPTFTYAELAVTGASPSSGPVTGGTIVTMTGTGFQAGVTQVSVVLTGGQWHREIPASAMTINGDGTTMSFAMPEGPAEGGKAGLVAFVPGIQARFVPTYTYVPAAAPRQRVADDGVATLPSSGTSSPALFTVALVAVIVGWAGFVVMTRRSTSRTP